MNTKVMSESRSEFEKLLAHSIMDVACELRLVDILDLAVLIRGDKHANLRDIVASSAELFFKPGALCYANAADIRGTWTSPFILTLDLEFQHGDTKAYFSLMLERITAAVHISRLEFDAELNDEADRVAVFARALSDARLGSAASVS